MVVDKAKERGIEIMKKEKMLELLNEFTTQKDYEKLEKLKDALVDDIRTEVSKENGNKSKDISIIKRIVKEKKINEKFGKYNEFDYNGKNYKGFLEGHYILASEKDFGYESNCEDKFKVENMFTNFDNDEDIRIKVDLVDLKTFIKIRTDKEKPYVMEIDGFKIACNPKFLIDCLTFCETDTIYCTNKVSPMFMKNNDDMDKIGMVLPIRIPNTI